MDSSHESIQDAERKRKIRVLRWIVYFGIVLQFVTTVLPVMGGSTVGLLPNAALLIVVIAGWALLRVAQLELATHLMFCALIAYSMRYGVEQNELVQSSQNLVIPIVGSILLLRPRWTFIYAAIGIMAFVFTYALAGPPIEGGAVAVQIFFLRPAGYFVMIALFCYFATRSYERVARTAMERSAELETIKGHLEERVVERTHAAEQALLDLKQSSELIRQLSVPVLPVAEGVLVLPLVGALDAQRAALLTDSLLRMVHRDQPQVVLIDITGLSLVDQFGAEVILETARAVRLLGAEPVLVGIRAELAQALVALGSEIQALTTRRDVRSGLAYALAATDRRGQGLA